MGGSGSLVELMCRREMALGGKSTKRIRALKQLYDGEGLFMDEPGWEARTSEVNAEPAGSFRARILGKVPAIVKHLQLNAEEGDWLLQHATDGYEQNADGTYASFAQLSSSKLEDTAGITLVLVGAVMTFGSILSEPTLYADMCIFNETHDEGEYERIDYDNPPENRVRSLSLATILCSRTLVDRSFLPSPCTMAAT